MNESYITVHGYVVAAPTVRTVGEHTVANFRIGVTPRKLERSSGEWRDAETQWYSVSAWRALGDNVARSLRRGDPVIVQGRLNARTWINASHAEVVAHDIEAAVVGHDLRRGVTTFAKTVPGAGEAPSKEEYGEGRRPGPSADQLVGQGATRQLEPLTERELASLLDGPGHEPTAGPTAEPAEGNRVPAETAARSDWNPPLQDAPDWAGAA
jgi:single-strand DNA-binding protein